MSNFHHSHSKENDDFYVHYFPITLITFKEGNDFMSLPEISLVFLGFHGQIIIELIQGYRSDLPTEGKVHHVAFTVSDLEKEKERLKELNVTFVDEEITTLPNGAKYLFFYGPDGEWVEFFEPKA
ncbi:VOC family protein [Bacillus songklensis]|uniref:VOC family protein n=1 Tax=Bacillus songklensis TaxID=1069116 RepID=A0ABV8B8Q0_9BACI